MLSLVSCFGFKRGIFVLSPPQTFNGDQIEARLWSLFPRLCIAYEIESLSAQPLEKVLFPKGSASTSGATWSSHLVLDSLPGDRHLLSGKGKSNNLCFMKNVGMF